MSSFDQPLDAFRHVQLRWQESLQELAYRELGDAARWVDIVNANKLLPPYITGDPLVAAGGRVAMYGATLVVPGGSSIPGLSPDPADAMGTDVALVDGFLTVSGGDLALVSGEANLVQALRNRLRSWDGDLMWHPVYGNKAHRLLGAGAGPATAFLASKYVRACLLSDPRVSKVTSATATVLGDEIRVDAVVVPISGQPAQVTT